MPTALSEMTSRILLSTLAAGILALAANPANAQEWSFQIEPYLLGVTIDGDAGIGRLTGVDVELDTGDILDNLDMGGMIHFEVRHESGMGVMVDYAFMDLSKDVTGPRGGVLDADVFQGVLEVLLMKDIGSGDAQLDIFGGVRAWDNEIEATFDPVILPGTASRKVEEVWVDLVVGARWINPISERWSFLLKGDIGGFGSDFTWLAHTGFRWRFGKTTELDLSYKALAVDYKTGTPGEQGYFKYDTITHGPVVGLVFNF